MADNNKIKKALGIIFTGYNINSKEELDVWCGHEGRNKLYNVIKLLANEHCNRLVDYKAYIRFYYEKILAGYKHYNPNYKL